MNNKEKIYLLKKEEMKLYNEIKNLTNQIKQINDQMKEILKTEPTCCVCGRHRLKEDMTIVTQDILNDYLDQNEGYDIPSLGEYYCGC
jgi:hypothetical protein